MRAVRISRFGGPEVLELVEADAPSPAENRLLVDVDSAGVNFADTHQIEDSYLAPQTLPLIPGGEVVGRVHAGPKAGQRVVALLGGAGGYAEQALAHPSTTFEVPEGISDGAALALVLQGTTAWHLLRTSTHLQPGEAVVVHAAAGGVGSLAVQLAKQWGAGRVIATASSPDKRELALQLGADVAVDVSTAGSGPEVRDLLLDANGGKGVDVVLEMTGGQVFDGSLSALAPLGRLAVFGMASRTPATPVDPARLMATSRTVTGFWLAHAMRRPDGLGPAMAELFSLVKAGRMRPVVGATFPLAGARQAHEALLARRTTGKVVLQVSGSAADPG